MPKFRVITFSDHPQRKHNAEFEATTVEEIDECTLSVDGENFEFENGYILI
jgi:hypothetical protein